MADPPRNWKDAERRLSHLEQTITDLSRIIRENEKRLAELPYMRKAIESVRSDCKAVREWVERQVERQQSATLEREKMSGQTKVAIIGGLFLLAATTITAIVMLSNAGAF